MPNRRFAAAAVLAVLAVLTPPPPAAAEGFEVVVNETNPLERLSRAEISKLFLRRSPAWPNGLPAVPCDLSATSPVREAFSTGVHKKAAWIIVAFWQQEIASGRSTPPDVCPSEHAALSLARASPGAVVYVRAGAALGPGVKILAVEP